MKLSVLGSSSKGNCYLLTSSTGETLIVECGVDFKEAKKALDWKLSGVVACLVSHEHKDHCKYLSQVLASGIRVLALDDVFRSQALKTRCFCTPVEADKGYRIGSFQILTLELSHDVPCLGYIIRHAEMGSLLFVTDTMSVDYQIPALTHIMIEANYAADILEENVMNGVIASAQMKRTRLSHCELQTTKNVLRSADLSKTHEVILLHLSGQNSDRDRFKSEVEAVTGLPTYIARQGLQIDLNINAI